MSNPNARLENYNDAGLIFEDLDNNINLLELAITQTNKITYQEKEALQKFLTNAIGNNKLGTVINEIIHSPKSYEFSETKLSAIFFISLFTYCTRHYDLLPDLEQLEIALVSLKEQENKYIFSSQQIGIINDLILLEEFFKQLELNQISVGELEVLKTKVIIAAEINKVIELEYSDLSLLSFQEDNAVDSFTKHDMLNVLVQYYTKVTKIMTVKMVDSESQDYELVNLQDQIDVAEKLEKKLFAGFYKINFNHLITKEYQKLIHKLYGKGWRDELASIMKEIENKIGAEHIYNTKKETRPIGKICFGNIFSKSNQLDHQNLNNARLQAKYAISKDPNLLMLVSSEILMIKIIEELESIVIKSLIDNNLLKNNQKIDIFKKPLKLNMLKEHVKKSK